MSHRVVRLIVLLAAVAAVCTGAFLVRDFERRSAEERLAADRFDASAHEAALLVERLRAAQQSYVAEGQGADFWMSRANQTSASLEQVLGQLASNALSDGGRTAVQAAAGLLVEHRTLDRRAREYLAAGQRLTASDLIFNESLAATTALALNVDRARNEERSLAESRLAALRLQELQVIGGAVGVCLVCLVLLVPGPKPPAPKDTREALRALINTETQPAGGLQLRPDPPARAASAPPAHAPEPPAAAATTQAAAAAPATSRSQVDLTGAARVCSDLARVLDPADLPRLMEQVARLLHASGLIVWVADKAGASLFPMLAHGYPPNLLTRMGSIKREDENAAAGAYRDGETRIVRAQGSAPGALVTPIITAEGCIGVLAAETLDGAEHDEGRVALARILAAQFATLVTTVPDPNASADAQV